MKNLSRTIKKQEGNVLFQVLAGLLVTAVIATGFITAITSGIDNAKVENVKTFFTDGMNSAIAWCYNSSSSLSDCDKDRLILIGKINEKNKKTEWGDVWTVTASASSVVITYPLTSSGDADNIGDILKTALLKTHAPITSTAYTNTNNNLTVTYGF